MRQQHPCEWEGCRKFTGYEDAGNWYCSEHHPAGRNQIRALTETRDALHSAIRRVLGSMERHDPLTWLVDDEEIRNLCFHAGFPMPREVGSDA